MCEQRALKTQKFTAYPGCKASPIRPKMTVGIPVTIAVNEKTDLLCSNDGSQLTKDGSGKRKGRPFHLP